jgi:hypothetical protein
MESTVDGSAGDMESTVDGSARDMESTVDGRWGGETGASAEQPHTHMTNTKEIISFTTHPPKITASRPR